MTLKEYVKTLSRETLIQIIKDHEQFAELGKIGDCTLRDNVEVYMKIRDIAEPSTIMWMELVANYAFREIAMEHLIATGEL